LGQVALTGIFPADAALTDFLALGQEDGNGFAGDWFLRIYSICATPLPGLELVSATVPPGVSTSRALTTGPCPTGKRVVGVGGEITGGEGEVVLTAVRPASQLTRGSVAAVADEDGFSGEWGLTAYAICATAPTGLEQVTATSDPDSDPASVTATCPAGKNLLGAGAQIENGVGQVVLDDVRPNALLTSVTVTALEDETGTTSTWFPVAHAICANA
jgi:hypothetical protein